jgi:hypothetical protein
MGNHGMSYAQKEYRDQKKVLKTGTNKKEKSMGKYEKFVIREPKVVCVDYHPTENVKGVTFPDEIWLDNTIVEGSPVVVDIGWRFEVPDARGDTKDWSVLC